MLEYIDTRYKPAPDDLVCQYHVEPDGISLRAAAEHIAAESSIGTWTDVATMNQRIATRLRPSVFHIDQKRQEIKIAYSAELFEAGNMPCILSSIAGNIYGMKVLNKLRLQDIHFPKSLVRSFPGPAFGIDGIRRLLRIRDRPLLGTIVKPKVGLTSKQHAHVAYEAWSGGLDVVKDDENLTSQRFNPFRTRIPATLEARDKAESETGERKVYMPNITAETEEMLNRLDYVREHGGRYIMVDILSIGWSGLQTVRKHSKGLVIHAHRAGHAALTRNRQHGISMLTIAKIARLIGMDQLHIGTAVGKMEGPAAEVRSIEREIEDDEIDLSDTQRILQQSWYGMRPTLAVSSGGLHPGHMESLIRIMGTDIVAQFGGGCHGHPGGTYAGAKSIRQAAEAVMQKIPLLEYAKDHNELAQALDKFMK